VIGGQSQRLGKFLGQARPSYFNAYCIIAAFGTYFCMYAFRKPFSVATFEGDITIPLLGLLNYKIVLIISQVFGYTASKFLGIKVVSEMKAVHRALFILLFIGAAELALLGFALTPKPWNFVFLFLNGLPLGMVWGLVFGFLEGRRSTELLGAGLSASYIVASGAVKSVGGWVLELGISEVWMPLTVGLLFVPFLLFFVFLLQQIPKPTKEDECLRMEREPMFATERKSFLKSFAPGLLALTGLYMLLTAYRDFRDNFAREIWDALGFGGQPEIFTTSELPIAFLVLLALALIMRIKNNTRALEVIHLIMLSGSVLIGVATLAYQVGVLDPALWMVAVGLGLYLAYVPYGCVFFDRLIASIGIVGTAGFMIYVTDAFGYLGSVALMLYKNFGQPDLSWLNFFVAFSYGTSIVCSACFLFSLFYFKNHSATKH
jgi:MFS family permease